MESLTTENSVETLAKVTPLLEEGRFGEALPFLELHKAKSSNPLWSYLTALVLACQDRGSEGLVLLEQTSQHPDFLTSFGLNDEINTLARTAALNHLTFETTVDEASPGPWRVLARFAELLNNQEFLRKAASGLLELEPENREFLTLFSNAFENTSPDIAIPILETIVTAHAAACRPRALLGSLLQKRGKTALAIRHLKTAIEADRQAMEPHLYLGQIYSSQARFDDAEKELSEALNKGQPTVALWVELATCQQATYRYDEAMTSLLCALAIHPPTFRHWDLLVDATHHAGKLDELLSALRRATESFPHDAKLSLRYAMVAFKHGDPLAAREQLQMFGTFEHPTRDTALTRLAAEVSLALEDPGSALKLVEALWKAHPHSPETSRVYGDFLILDHQPTEAESLLRETAKNNPNDRALQISWGRALLALKDYERAHRAFSLASRLDPDDAEAMAEQGCTMLKLGLHDEALNVLKDSAKKCEPPLAISLQGLGSVYEYKGIHDIARDFYRQALARDPQRLEAARGFVRTRPTDGTSSLALEALELLSKLPDSYAPIKLWLSVFKAAFLESLPEEAREFKTKVFPQIFSELSDTYRSFFKTLEESTLIKLAQRLEQAQDIENSREIWRYAISSCQGELAHRATEELRRLDTYHGNSLTTTHSEVASISGSSDDLSSLLSGTLAHDPSLGHIEAPLFADIDQSPSEGDDVLSALLAIDLPSIESSDSPPSTTPVSAQPSTASAGSSLFEETPEPQPAEALPSHPAPQANTALESSLFEETPEPQPAETLPSSPAPQADVALENSSFEETTEPQLTETLPSSPAPQADVALESSLFEETPEPQLTETLPSSPASRADVALEHSSFAETPEPQLAATLPSSPAPQADVALENSSFAETPEPQLAETLPSSPVTQTDIALESSYFEETPESQPIETLESTPSTPTPTEILEELQPIPMPIDFSPLTRRQLHYHEVLATHPQGVLNAESLAHLLLQSATSYEPPDPTRAAPHESLAHFQQALLASAIELEGAQQFRAAVRILRTALLYQPQEAAVLDTLARVQRQWATWLVEQEEFAHAVNLLRDILQRQPHSEATQAQLETSFKAWITWSLDSGDPAASDLLAVYLAQEKTAIESLKQEWDASRARIVSKASNFSEATAPPSAPVAPIFSKAPTTQSSPQLTKTTQETAAPSSSSKPDAATRSEEVVSPASATHPQTSPPPKEPAPLPTEEPATAPPTPSKESVLEALVLAPDDKTLMNELFDLYSNSMRELISVLKDKVNHHLDNPIWLLLLARAYRRGGPETMAVIQYQKYIKACPSREAYEELAQTYEELGKEDFAKMTRRKAERA